MLGYYSLSRRRSSQKDPPSPSLPLYSSSLNEPRSPPSPKQLTIPTSPSAEKQLTSDDLGSPFSITNPIYPFQPDHHSSSSQHSRNHYDTTTRSITSLPTLSEDSIHNQKDRNRDRDDILNSVGSNAPLLARDFGMSGASRQIYNNNNKTKSKSREHANEIEEEDRNGIQSITSDSFDLLPGDDSSLPKSAIDLPSQRERTLSKNSSNIFDDPTLIPPKSIHDEYVSKHIQPITLDNSERDKPPLQTRPSLNRSTSAPGHPSQSKNTTSPPSNNTGLLPSAVVIPSSGSPVNDPISSNEHNKQPIYEIYNANLSTEGLDMSKKLRNYLEVVLKGQDQVGKMHLNLEGIGMGEKGIWQVGDKDENHESNIEESKNKIEERQKGVEDIMQTLGDISDTLRNYHQLGTPKLVFSRQQSNTKGTGKAPRTPTTTNTSNLGRATTISGSPPSPEISKNGNQRQRAPTLMRSNTAVGDLSPNSIKTDKLRPRSPLMKSFTKFTSSSDDDEQHHQSQPKKISDSPEQDINEPSIPFPYKPSKKLPYLDMDKLENGNTKNHNHASENENDHHSSHHHWFGQGNSPDNKSGKRERKITDSPVEMNFSSRW
ncbi:uncharacterized protein L201_000136 [Kwoniella dendrophila CBS 6074]|uniref:Uncharacterized protein n=1 Tax=Kwoniella dendrophila CBS 6074 TaxID=1295534 RepID=A0AAX4JII0_9TREE